MRGVFKWILVLIIGLIIGWLAGSFAMMEFNVVEWSQGGRVFLIIGVFCVWGVMLMVMESDEY